MYAHPGKLIVVLVFVLHGAAPAASHVIANSSRIVGGSDATNIDTSYVVSIHRYGSHCCGGSIINQRTVVTAAHCLVRVSASYLQVLAGTKILSNPKGVLLRVQAFHAHPAYNKRTLDYDIGLVRLAAPLTFGSSIRPIRLADFWETVPDNSWATVFGWGRRQIMRESSKLQFASVPIINQEICSQAPNYILTDRMLCAGYLKGGIDACGGDSGGPLVWNNKLIGIVSWGVGCARPNQPGVYARVTALRSWVDKTLAEHYKEAL